MEQLISALNNLILEEFAAISISRLVAAVVIACGLGLLIGAVYKITYSGVLISKSFLLGLALLSMITSVIILAISANLVLSLGMVGALSIVRFRTAVKDPMDTIFMFWSLATGILAGAGFFLIAILATVLIGGLFIVLNLYGGVMKNGNSYLLVIRYEEEGAARVLKALAGLGDYRLKSRNTTGEYEELVVEIKLAAAQLKKVDSVRELPGIMAVNLVALSSGTQL